MKTRRDPRRVRKAVKLALGKANEKHQQEQQETRRSLSEKLDREVASERKRVDDLLDRWEIVDVSPYGMERDGITAAARIPREALIQVMFSASPRQAMRHLSLRIAADLLGHLMKHVQKSCIGSHRFEPEYPPCSFAEAMSSPMSMASMTIPNTERCGKPARWLALGYAPVCDACRDRLIRNGTYESYHFRAAP